MIDKEIFGKGEATLIDRKAESFPYLTEAPESPSESFQQYHDAFLREHFYVLRKIFHTFAFDMKEFAIDFHEVQLDRFLRALTWLTYVQTIVYEMDINVEQESLGPTPANGPDLDRVGQRIISFLEDHDLLDPEIHRCVSQVVTYLQKERRESPGQGQYSKEEILSILGLKSADLECCAGCSCVSSRSRDIDKRWPCSSGSIRYERSSTTSGIITRTSRSPISTPSSSCRRSAAI